MELVNNQMYSYLFNKLNDVVLSYKITDEGKVERIEELNKKASELLGYSKEELKEKSIFDISTIEHGYDYSEILNNLLERGEYLYTAVFMTKSGKNIPVEINSILIKNGENRVVDIIRDISERSEKDKEIRSNREMLKLISESSITGIGLYSHRFLFVNDTFCKITGYSKEELQTIDPEELIDGAEHQLKFSRITKKQLEGKENNISYELPIKTKSNRKKWLQIHSTSFRLKDEFVSLFNVLDITQNRKLKKLLEEEREKRREKEALLAQKSKFEAMGQVVETIIHQWRQPLNAISVIADVMRDSDEETKEELFKRLKHQITHMDETINEFRAFLKPDKSSETFSLIEVVKQSVNLLSPLLQKKNISINVVESTKKELEVFGYKNELKQVFINIITNAQDAIELLQKKEKNYQGKIEIVIKAKKREVEISILDNGGGIEKEYLKNIFDEYFTTKEDYEGTGIGLHISKTIIEGRMKGKISCINRENGVEFIIKLPIFNKQE